MPTNELECSNVKQPEGGVLVQMMDLPIDKSPSKRRTNHKAISFLARSNNAIKGGKFSNIFHVLANPQQDEQGSATS